MNEQDTQFKNLIQKNLTTSGFPQKKVSFPLEKLYEIADKKEANLNIILEQMQGEGIGHEKGPDKITFFSLAESYNFKNLNKEDMLKKAEDLMSKMKPEEIENIQKTLASMTPEQRDELMAKAREMNLV